MSHKARSPIGGFTIMEVGVAAAVLAFTLVGMIGAIESGAKMLDLSRRQTTATQILRSEIEQLRAQDWSTVVGYYNNYGTSSATVTLDSSLNTATNGFSATRAIHELNSSLLQVTYTVSWTGLTGTTYKRSSTTYVGQNGLYLAYQKS